MKETFFNWLWPVLLLISILPACATTYVAEQQSFAGQEASSMTPLPEYHGPKTIVAVLPLGLSKRAAQRYPQLLAKSVGLGIHNRVVETLYDSKRFRFVEDQPKVIKNVLDRQWLSAAGMVSQGTAVELGKQLGASKVIYGEVYDFSQGGEKIVGLKKVEDNRTRVGIQIRIVDAETLEYIPGSGVGYGADTGEAAGRAIHDAVLGLLRRLPGE